MSTTAQFARQAVITRRQYAPEPQGGDETSSAPENTVSRLIMQSLSVHATMQLKAHLMHRARLSPFTALTR